MTETTTQTEAPAPVGLTIQDLTLMLQVLQVCTSRSAFKADELTAVGGLYDRLFKFLESAGAITKTPPAEAAPTEAPAPVVTETAKPAAKVAAAKKTKAK
jgi:hypothetical protein